MSSFNDIDRINRAHDKLMRVSGFAVFATLAFNFAVWGAIIYAAYKVLDHFKII